VLQAVAMQTRLPDKIIIFDDNDNVEDIRQKFLLNCILHVLNEKKVTWEVRVALKKGQHHIHQFANTYAVQEGFDWVWRVDDDCVPEPGVLENLEKHITEEAGAIGGSIFVNTPMDNSKSTGKIEMIDNEANIQWGYIKKPVSVEHLHCSFIYRAGIHDYCIGLSKVAHREETLFTYGVKRKGYQVLAVPNAVSWHMRNPQGGIRSQNDMSMYQHDEIVFRNTIAYKDKTIVVLNEGMGDHLVFKHVLPDVKNPEVFSCYPEIVPGRPIADAINLFGDITRFNIYHKMNEWNWKGTLQDAFRKMYVS
jgi:hypothetical protein